MDLVVTLFCRLFDIFGRRSEPEVEHVIFDVQFTDYLRFYKDLVIILRTPVKQKMYPEGTIMPGELIKPV